MQPPILPENEEERLKSLLSYNILDTDFEVDFDEIIELASRICETPISLITLVDSHRQWFKSKKGILERESSRELSFCGHGILSNHLFEVEDARTDDRFFDNPYVTESPNVVFYAGYPLESPEGTNIGMLCVIDNIPRTLNENQKTSLQILSRYIITLLELRKKGEIMKKAFQENEMQKLLIEEKNNTINDSIEYARVIQLAMMENINVIKESLPEIFIYNKPLGVLSGDIYYYFRKSDKIFLAVIDCTGHGIPGALLSIMALNFLTQLVEYEGLESPNLILEKLHQNIQYALRQKTSSNNDGMDISLICFDLNSKMLEFSGSKNSLYIFEDDQYTELKADKFSIGGKEKKDGQFSLTKFEIKGKAAIYAFSDGIYHQIGGLSNTKLQKSNFMEFLKSIHKSPAAEQEKLLDTHHKAWKGNNEQTDDIIVMGLQI